METILGLLLVLLPLVFKLVEKILKSSGKTEAAGKVHEWAEVFGNRDDDDKDDDEDRPVAVPVKQAADIRPVGKPVPVDIPEEAPGVVPSQPKVQAKPLTPRTRKPASKPVLVEEEKKSKKEKIDPKKLVVYSEIMKPKF